MKRKYYDDGESRTYKKAKQILGTVAASTLGFISMNVPGAMIAGKKVYDYLEPEVLDEEVSPINLMPGTYQGKFALSARNTFKGLRDEYQKKGGVFIVENYGAVSDPDLVYIGHSSWNNACVINAVGIALLRKLFLVGVNINVQTTVEELPLINTVPDSGPNGYTIVYEARDSDGTKGTAVHPIPDNASLETLLNQVVTGYSLYNALDSQLREENPGTLEKIYLYSNHGSNLNLVYQMDIAKEVLSVAMSSHMVVQNRTKAAADGSLSTTQIDVQPLKGPVYEFSNGVPKLKGNSPIQLNQMENQGLVLARAGQFGGTDTYSFREPPVKKAFQNVVKSGFVRLNPGALKSMTVGTDIRGYFNNVMFKLRYNTQTTQTKNCFGKSQIVCLEEELNSGSANLITVQYECQHIAGAHLITTSNPNCQPGYSASEINNVPS